MLLVVSSSPQLTNPPAGGTIDLMPNPVSSSQFSVISRIKSVNRQPITVNRKSYGFTLIELLVVITIIGILAGLTLVSFSGAQARARDSKRKSDLDAIKKTLELAKQDTPGAYSYPLKADDTTLSPTYIKTVPKDPKTGSPYFYTPTKSDDTPCLSQPECALYSLTACLENKSDSQKDALKYSACTDASYTVSSQ